MLHDASKETSSEQIAAFKQFISGFGTHFLTDVQLGATFSQVTSYSSSVRKEFDFQTLQDCNYVSGAKVFGIQVEPNSNNCDTNDQQELQEYTTTDVNVQIKSKGSDPTNISDWATQDFTPVPLKYTFSPIANIFQEQFIEKINYKNGDGEPINSTAIRQWFVPLYYNYCHKQWIWTVMNLMAVGMMINVLLIHCVLVQIQKAMSAQV